MVDGDMQVLGRGPSTISRELRRNAATRGGKLDYRASVAQWKAELFARRPKTAKLAETGNSGTTSSSAWRGGSPMRRAGSPLGRRREPGPAATSRTVRTGKWVQAWSPEQIAQRLKIDFPGDTSMRISHEQAFAAAQQVGQV